MNQTEVHTISINDVVHTLRECDRNARYEGMLEHMLLFASELTGQSEDALLYAMYPDKEHSVEEPVKQISATIIEYNNQEPPFLYQDLKIWCNAAGELWDPHKEQYIETKQLPRDLLAAYETLWEGTGDDYLVEYHGQYYYMLDYVYHEKMVLKDGEYISQDSYETAKFNAQTVAKSEALNDTIILLSKASPWIGQEHFVSVLINPYESNENLTNMKESLALHMFQNPDMTMTQPLHTKIESASLRTAHTIHSEKDSIKLIR